MTEFTRADILRKIAATGRLEMAGADLAGLDLTGLTLVGADLIREIDGSLQAYSPFEIIVVDDGSTDGTGAAAKVLPHVRVLRHPVSAGQSAAVHSGVMAARAEVVCTLDGDGQNPPANHSAKPSWLRNGSPAGLMNRRAPESMAGDWPC